MRTVTERKQTLLRLPPSLVEELMNFAKEDDKSFNSFMEDILSKEVERRKINGILSGKSQPSELVMRLRGCLSLNLSDDMIESDYRLAHAFAYEKK